MIGKKPGWLPHLGEDPSGAPTPAARPRVRKQLSSDTTAPSHPWSELVLRDDRIMQVPYRKAATEYLATPEVKIVGKKEVIAGADGGRASYAFKLNTVPDVWWRDRFAHHLEDPPKGINRSDIRVEIQDDTLLLLCLPTRLEEKYAFIKATVTNTNSDYEREKAKVRDRVAELAARKRRQSGRTNVDRIRERWERL